MGFILKEYIGSDGFLNGLYREPSDRPLILPPQKSNRSGFEHVQRFIRRRIKDPDLRAKTDDLYEEVWNLVSASNGDMDIIEEFSEGGSRDTAINKDFVGYVHIKMCGLSILEAIGQINNATYILVDDENLESNLQKTRKELEDSKNVIKLSHEANLDSKYGSYNFEGSGIKGILECIVNDKNRFLQMSVPENLYSNLSRVLRNYQIAKLVEEYGISANDLNSIIKQYASEKDVQSLTDKQEEFASEVESLLEENHDDTNVGKALADLSAQIKKAKELGNDRR